MFLCVFFRHANTDRFKGRKIGSLELVEGGEGVAADGDFLQDRTLRDGEDEGLVVGVLCSRAVVTDGNRRELLLVRNRDSSHAVEGVVPNGQLLEEAVSRQVNDGQASVVAAVVAHGETGDVRIDGPQIRAGTQLCLLQQARDERI